ILGNMHNLFGDTASMDVQVFDNGDVEVYASSDGDTVAGMLEYVRLEPETLLTRYREQVAASGLPEEEQAAYLTELEAGLYGYTYLEEI
ncbi:MAG: arginine decarboxylase, partial [Plesiomonas shigelloides]